MDDTVIQPASLAMIDYGVMGLYLLFVMALGLFFSRNEDTTDEFLLGGRRMHWLVIGISYMVSVMSTISLVAIPGEAFSHGITKSIEALMIPLASVLAFFLFVRFYFQVKTYTPFSYLERRFDRRVRLVACLIFWWTRIAYLAMVLYSSSKVFEGAAGWPVWFTICLVGLVGIFYTALGGMKAVVWTDLAQFIILVGGVVTIAVLCAGSVSGGVPGIIRYAFENGRGFEGFKDPDFFTFSPYVRLSFWMIACNLFIEHLFFNSADQISLQRLLSTSSYAQARRSLFTFIGIVVPFSCLLWFLGLAIFAYYGHHPEEAGQVTGDTALFQFISNHMPPPLPGLMIAAMLAAVMSTLDSGMNSLAAVALKDVYTQYFRRDAPEKEQVFFSRVMTAVVGVIAIAIAQVIASVAMGIRETIMEAGTVWLSFSIVLAPMFLIGVTTRKVNGTHILFACACAWAMTAATVVWYVMAKTTAHPVGFLFVQFPGLVVMLVLGYLPVLFPGRIDPAKTDGLTYWSRKS